MDQDFSFPRISIDDGDNSRTLFGDGGQKAFPFSKEFNEADDEDLQKKRRNETRRVSCENCKGVDVKQPLEEEAKQTNWIGEDMKEDIEMDLLCENNFFAFDAMKNSSANHPLDSDTGSSSLGLASTLTTKCNLSKEKTKRPFSASGYPRYSIKNRHCYLFGQDIKQSYLQYGDDGQQRKV